MQNDLIIERREDHVSDHRPETAAEIGTILFHVHKDDGLEQRLQVALSIARASEAHLRLLHVTPIEAYSVIDAYGVFVSGQIVEALQKEAEELRAQLENQLSKEDVSWDYQDVTGELLPHMIHEAALADLVIVGRERVDPEFVRPTITLLGDLIHRVRTPLLIIGDDVDQFDPIGPAVVAWNGSYECANAIRAALPLLKLASSVRLLTIEEDRKRARTFPSTRALEYLSRRGIHAELVVRSASAGSFADDLVSFARKSGARYIVMGGYSHARAGEYLFGGTTRDLLTRSPITLVVGR